MHITTTNLVKFRLIISKKKQVRKITMPEIMKNELWYDFHLKTSNKNLQSIYTWQIDTIIYTS